MNILSRFYQIPVFLELYFKSLKRYKLSDLIWPFIVIPLTTIMNYLFRSEYIQSVDFYGKIVPYIYILFFGFLIIDSFSDIVPTIFYNLLYNIKRVFYYDKAQWIISIIIFNFFKIFVRFLPVFLFFHFYYKLPWNFFYISLLSSVVFIPFILSVALILSYFVFRFRRDSEPIWYSISGVAWAIFPLGYSLIIFPEGARKLLEILLPPFGIIEEFRKLAILGRFDSGILILSFVFSVVYLIVGIFVFKYSFDMARKTGRISLE